MQYSPLPWTVVDNGIWEDNLDIYIIDACGNVAVSEIGGDTNEQIRANAKFIVKLANSVKE